MLGALDVLPVAAALLGAVRADDGSLTFETVHANANARRLGVSSNVSGDPLLGLLSTADRAELLRALERAYETGGPLEERVTLSRLVPGHDGPTEQRVIVQGHRVGGQVLVSLVPDDEDVNVGAARAEVQEARSHARRLEVLQRVTAALVGADTVEEVSAVILDELFRAKPLVAGVVAVLDDERDCLRLASARGLGEDVLRRRARMSLADRELPLVVAVRTGKPEWLPTRAHLLAAYPHMRASQEAVTQAIAALPLEAELGPVGSIAISFAQPTRFDRDLQEFLLTLARQCARAVERALLVESERIARVRAARLQRITEDLAGAESRERVAGEAVRLLAEALDAEGCALYLLGNDEGVLRRAAAHGRCDEEALPTLVPFTGAHGLASVVRSKHARYDEGCDLPATPACVHLPLLHDGRAIGGVALTFAKPRRFAADARAYCGAIAHQVSLALDRARLHEENLRRSRHLTALAEASGLFAATALDVSALAQSVVRCASDAVGGTCLLWLLGEDGGHLETVALAGAPPELQAELWGVVDEDRLRLGEGITGAAVARGEPIMVPLLEDGSLPSSFPTPAWPVLPSFRGGHAMAVPLRAHGQVLGALSLIRGPGPGFTRDDLSLAVDIGERAGLALYTARLYDETQGAVRVRDDFLSIAGHELRTPLTALHLQLQSLVRHPERASSPEVLREHAQRMAQQTHRLARLITELLDVSRIVRGRLSLELDDVDLVELTRSVLDLCEADLRRADCEVVVRAPPSLVGRWDKTRVEQVLQNLLLNACKYGRGHPVEIEVSEHDESARVVVRDGGIGIPPDDQARIFERFERAVPSRHFGGFGLGLWISRQVVEAHGGTISVESRPGAGATFSVVLPCARGGG